MNILTTEGWVSRFVTDWAGPDATIRKLSLKLGAPNLPGDAMMMTGTVQAKERPERGGRGGGQERLGQSRHGDGRAVAAPLGPALERRMSRTLKDQAAIVGIGQTEFSKNSGRSELQLAVRGGARGDPRRGPLSPPTSTA